VKLHWLLLPQASEATQLTVVMPTGNSEPEGGVHTMVTGPAQLSVAVTAKLTTVPFVSHAPATKSLGHWMTGAVGS
jgi:hypothetical protein